MEPVSFKTIFSWNPSRFPAKFPIIDDIYLILGVSSAGYHLTSWQLYSLDTGLDQDAAICLSAHQDQRLACP